MGTWLSWDQNTGRKESGLGARDRPGRQAPREAGSKVSGKMLDNVVKLLKVIDVEQVQNIFRSSLFFYKNTEKPVIAPRRHRAEKLSPSPTP